MDVELCLKWNNHITAIEKLLTNLHLNELYSDVTISCQGNFYPVHRFVLSICSEYFHEMFIMCGRLNKPHPFIIIKDINPLHMEAILNYMYKGEVNVTQSMLPDLLKAAEALKIKGLVVPDDTESPIKSSKKRPLTHGSSSPRKRQSIKRHKNNSIESSESSNNKNTIIDKSHFNNISDPTEICSRSSSPSTELENTTVKIEPEEFIETFSQDAVNNLITFKMEQSDNHNSFEDDDNEKQDFDAKEYNETQDFEEDDELERKSQLDLSMNLPLLSHMNLPLLSHLEQVLESSQLPAKKEKLFYCTFCPYKSTDKSNRNRHVKIHTGEASFCCPHCSYTSIRKYRLLYHVKKQHPL